MPGRTVPHAVPGYKDWMKRRAKYNGGLKDGAEKTPPADATEIESESVGLEVITSLCYLFYRVRTRRQPGLVWLDPTARSPRSYTVANRSTTTNIPP